jgi:hypothetical protein
VRPAAAKVRLYEDWDHLMACLHRVHGQGALDKLCAALELSRDWDRKRARYWARIKPHEVSIKSELPPYDRALRWVTANFAFTPDDLAWPAERYQFDSDQYAFIGRAVELELLDGLLQSGEYVCLTGASLLGAGGMGKTAIANHYARSRRSRYSAVIWIDARKDLESQINDFARKFAGVIPSGDGSFDQRIGSVFEKMALNLRRRLLVVFDDVPASRCEESLSPVESQIERVLAALPEKEAWRYHFLLTSRHRARISNINPVNVQRMIGEDAIALFLERSGYQREQVDLPRLRELVEELLGGHPLSITLLAAYAGKKKNKNIEELSALVRRQIVDAQELGEVKLPEYQAGIRATFEISFNELTREAQLLLLLLAMFRRGVIALTTIKACARLMGSDIQTDAVRRLHDELVARAGRSKSARLLTRLALLERVGVGQSSSSEVKSVQLHEVIYDFAQAQWASLRRDAEWAGALGDLELAFTRGAIRYASSAIEASRIQFEDVDSLTGLLLPRVKVDRGFVPSLLRISESLQFWYEYFVFQNFVYDTGLQDALLEQMIELREYLASQNLLGDSFGLILDKLIGHAYYADPDKTGALATECFDRALMRAHALEARKETGEGEIPIARWYRVFLLDHRSNVASKKRAALSPIRQDQSFATDFAAIESALPANLRALDAVPSKEECELLLRAAHYWGHRGNQDSFTLHQRFISQNFQGVDDGVAQSAISSYVLAANYRLLGLRIFRSGQFQRYLASHVRRGKVPLLAKWIDQAPALKPERRFESFTSLAQGVGDAAHQYRGLHFVYVLQFLITADAVTRRELREQAENAFKCAQLLWDIAERVRHKSEAPLRYKLWMTSSNLLMKLVDELAAGRPAPAFDVMSRQLREAIVDTQKAMRTPYHYSAIEQEKQLQGIWGRLAPA